MSNFRIALFQLSAIIGLVLVAVVMFFALPLTPKQKTLFLMSTGAVLLSLIPGLLGNLVGTLMLEKSNHVNNLNDSSVKGKSSLLSFVPILGLTLGTLSCSFGSVLVYRVYDSIMGMVLLLILALALAVLSFIRSVKQRYHESS